MPAKDYFPTGGQCNSLPKEPIAWDMIHQNFPRSITLYISQESCPTRSGKVLVVLNKLKSNPNLKSTERHARTTATRWHVTACSCRIVSGKTTSITFHPRNNKETLLDNPNSSMVWIGLGALVASASFLIYRYPPGSWGFMPWDDWLQNLWSKPKTLPGSSPQSPTPARQTRDKSEPGRDKIQDGDIPVDSRPDDATPKAKPVALPAMEVPVLNLDESSVVLDQTPTAVASSSNNALQSRSIPTFQPLPPPSPMSQNSLMSPPPRPKPNAQPQLSPPPRPNQMLPPPRPSLNVPVRLPPSAASSLRVPPSRLTSSTLPATKPSGKPQKTSRQVTLEPGHSPLDWAALTSNPNHKLRGENMPANLIRVTPSMLKAQNGRKGRDAWTSYMGKVYNITPYLPFHPGGKGELLRGAGRDSEKLFLEIHPWVNWDGMLAECMVGILVSEEYGAANAAGGAGSLEDMD
ncbi:hypothetical protein FQN50_006982 [Emmonsiellopsis sp. PD_5]|nr:hypothetical protein FQN50_006982 [Emmonsiellopsis sp. PD_5]